MTICIATDSFPPHNSGIATHNFYLARLLKENGDRVIVLTADFENPKQEDSIVVRDDVTVVKLGRSNLAEQEYFKKFIRNGNREAAVWLGFGMAMRKWLLKNKEQYAIDLVECADYGGYGLFLIDENLPPVVVMCHGLLTQMDQYEFHNQDENLQLIRFLETNMIQQADTVICHSELNREDISRDFKIKALYATAAWIHDPITPGSTKDAEFIVASRLTGHKGSMVMADTMQSLLQTNPGIKIVWVGQDSYTAPAGWIVSRYIKKHYPKIWQKTFIWKKAVPRDEMMQLIDNSEAVVIPSPWETFNYVALEAANRKKALIVTKQTGIASLLKNEENMLLADASNPETIANAMLKIHKDKQMALKLGQNLFESTSEIFSKENILKDRSAAYAHAINYRKMRTVINPLQSFF